MRVVTIHTCMTARTILICLFVHAVAHARATDESQLDSLTMSTAVGTRWRAGLVVFFRTNVQIAVSWKLHMYQGRDGLDEVRTADTWSVDCFEVEMCLIWSWMT